MSFSSLSNITQKQARTLLSFVNDNTPTSPFEESKTQIIATTLTFYPDCLHCEISDDSSVPVKTISALLPLGSDHSPALCRYTREWVLEMNKIYNLTLTQENLSDYMAFYLQHVALKAGKMVFLKTIEDTPWRDEPPMEVRTSLSSLLTPFVSNIDEVADDEAVSVVFNALYSGSLMRVSAQLTRDGAITIGDSEPLAADLPVFSQAYGL